MEWKNDILSFSGFDYGVSKRPLTIDEGPNELQLALVKESSTSQDEVRNVEEQGENDHQKHEQMKETVRNDLVLKEIELDPMSERKIENLYFRNAEQAERKMKLMTQIKLKLSEPRKTGDEIKSKTFLKPIFHENPWKTGAIVGKEENMEKNKKQNGKCTIS